MNSKYEKEYMGGRFIEEGSREQRRATKFKKSGDNKKKTSPRHSKVARQNRKTKQWAL